MAFKRSFLSPETRFPSCISMPSIFSTFAFAICHPPNFMLRPLVFTLPNKNRTVKYCYNYLMTSQEIIEKVNGLQLPIDEFVVFGSCPMALAGIRESNDIDMAVTPKLFADLEKQGWKKLFKAPGD